jgi:hypothetical protein
VNVELTGSAEDAIAQLAEGQGWSSGKALAFIIEFYSARSRYMESDDFEAAPEAVDYGVRVI